MSINHAFYSGIGHSGNYSSNLPEQFYLESQKNQKWVKLNLDRLESIAVQQYHKNIQFNDYYEMVKGNMIYADYGLEGLSKEIVRLREETASPVHAKHYDFLGIICNQIESDWITAKSKFRIDNTDPISQNDFIRDQNDKLLEYTQKNFNLELEQKLLARGITINDNQQFNSEEEKQAYYQQLQLQKDQLISPEVIQKTLFKDWKTTAAEWAEKTFEIDTDRFGMEKMSRQEMVDRLLTGRWFRHYHIGYDHYKPERWHPCQVSFSEDLDIEYPQDAEYVSHLSQMSASKIVSRFGDKLTEEAQKRLMGYYNPSVQGHSFSSSSGSLESIVRGNFGNPVQVPFAGFYDHDLTLQMQDLLQVPLGESTSYENGVETKAPAWFTPLNRGAGFINNTRMGELRSDIDVRNDTLQVTESYWRSWKRVGVLNYINPDGYLDQVFTTDDLLKEYLSENDIQTLRNVSLEEAEKKLQPNTISYTWIPEIRWGVKVKAHNSFLKEDLYIGGDALPFQIKGTLDGGSNLYDAKIPVAGYIGDSIAKKMRPYIIKHNIVLNQVYSLLEKELGTFFLFDVKYLPSEYKGSGSTRDALEQMYDLIQDIGLVPIDTSKQNMEGGQPAMNAFSTQSIDYTGQINNRMNLAVQFKIQALEQIGITPQRIGTPSEYATAEGIKQGNTASYAQTEGLFAVMAEAEKKATLIHLTVAQYCQKNYKDFSYLYTKSDGEKAFIELNDPYFQLREWGLTLENSSNGKKELENLRNYVLSNNTVGADILDIAEIVTSKSMSSIINHAKQNRIDAMKKEEAQRNHEQQMQDQMIAAQEKSISDKYTHEINLQKMKDETAIEVKSIDSYGKMSINQDPGSSLYDRLDKVTESALNNDYKNTEFNLKQQNLNLKEQEFKSKIDKEGEELRLKAEALAEKRAKRLSDERIAIINPQ